MAVAWLLKDERISTVLVGVSKKQQLMDNIGALNNLDFGKDELQSIEEILQ